MWLNKIAYLLTYLLTYTIGEFYQNEESEFRTHGASNGARVEDIHHQRKKHEHETTCGLP